nr:efflux RND transporter periplasmic adaptor subunit [Sneathiella litorea]
MVATKPVIEPELVEERVWTVAAIPVEFKDQSVDLNLFGSLKAVRDVELRSLVGGEVVEVGDNFREGALLEKGELLVRVDPFDFESQLSEKEAALLEARARLNELVAIQKSEEIALDREREVLEREVRNVERSESLAKRGNISVKSLDDARSTLSRQRQTVESREAQLDILKPRIGQQRAVIDRLDVGVRRAERDLANTSLRAPFRGYVTEVSAEFGKNIGASDKVARVIDAAQMEARFLLSDSQYGLLLGSSVDIVGRPVTVSWESGDTELVFNGQVARLSPEISSETGGLEVFAILDTSEYTSLLRPGAFVEVVLLGNRYLNVAKLPDSSIFENTKVYVVKDGRLEPRTIEIVAQNGSDVLVRGDLVGGELVVTTRLPEIGPNLKVEVR